MTVRASAGVYVPFRTRFPSLYLQGCPLYYILGHQGWFVIPSSPSFQIVSSNLIKSFNFFRFYYSAIFIFSVIL